LKTPEILAVVSSLSNTITEFSNQSSKFFWQIWADFVSNGRFLLSVLLVWRMKDEWVVFVLSRKETRKPSNGSIRPQPIRGMEPAAHLWELDLSPQIMILGQDLQTFTILQFYFHCCGAGAGSRCIRNRNSIWLRQLCPLKINIEFSTVRKNFLFIF
jgi:hypothetical protein